VSPALSSTEWGEGADGRNQVIAGCGNGSLRLFDMTLEVCLYSRSCYLPIVETKEQRMQNEKKELMIRAYRLKYGMNIPPRSIR